VWGILLVVGVAFTALVEQSPTWRTWVGVAFGIGVALIVDEIALLVELKDVYWSEAGDVSIAVGILMIDIGGSVLALTRSPPQRRPSGFRIDIDRVGSKMPASKEALPGG
jgi:hypothetical protein